MLHMLQQEYGWAEPELRKDTHCFVHILYVSFLLQLPEHTVPYVYHVSLACTSTQCLLLGLDKLLCKQKYKTKVQNMCVSAKQSAMVDRHHIY